MKSGTFYRGMKWLEVSTDSCPVQRTLDVNGEMWTLLILREAGDGLRYHIGQAPPRSAWQQYRTRCRRSAQIESSGSAVGWSGQSARRLVTLFAKDVACWIRKAWRH